VGILTRESKDSTVTLPGFEIYAQLKPILPFWQWVLAVFIGIIFSSAYWTSPEFVPSPWQILIFVLVLLGLVIGFALFLRRRFVLVGMKRQGSTVLVAGKTISENLSNASKIEMKSPVSMYVEKPGGRMQLRKMLIRFSTSEEGKRVMEWLARVPESASRLDSGLSETGEVWALVYAGEYVKRSRIQFEDNVCYVVDPGRNIFEVKPKRIERKDEVTLNAFTGFWSFGNITLRFDSVTDADKIENVLRKNVSSSA